MYQHGNTLVYFLLNKLFIKSNNSPLQLRWSKDEWQAPAKTVELAPKTLPTTVLGLEYDNASSK